MCHEKSAVLPEAFRRYSAGFVKQIKVNQSIQFFVLFKIIPNILDTKPLNKLLLIQ